nr:keratin, type I cytoskeletal 9-like [Aegilops tauschii subsp. strangulata]
MTRAVYLEAEFHGLIQGDLSITAYCHHLKALSDAHSNVGTPISDQTLVLNCLRGLNPRFSDITTITAFYSSTNSHGATGSNSTGQHRGSDRGDGTRNTHTSIGGSFGGNRNSGNWCKKKSYGGGHSNGGNSGGSSSGASDSNAQRGAFSSVGPWVCFNPYTGQA